MTLLETAVHFKTDVFFNTDTLLSKGLNNYSLSKKQFAEWLQLFSEGNLIKGVNLRIEHIYGPKDDTTKFVSWLLFKMATNEKRIQLTKGDQKRDFVYIEDVVSAYLILLNQIDNLNGFSEFDVGTGVSVPVKDFVLQVKNTLQEIEKRTVNTLLDFGAIPYRQDETMEIKAETDKLKRFGWQPNYNIREGLDKYIRTEKILRNYSGRPIQEEAMLLGGMRIKNIISEKDS